MTWTPSEVNRRAAAVVAEILDAQEQIEQAYGIGLGGKSAARILLQHCMLNLIAGAIGQAAFDDIKAKIEARDRQRAAANGSLPYSTTAEYQAKREEILRQQRPGSDVNNAADIAAYQEASGEAALARWARARGPDMTARCVIPLAPGLPPGTVIFHNGQPHIVAADGKAYPPAKDNLQEQAAAGAANLRKASDAMLAEKLTTLETLKKEGFAHTITMTEGPKPGSIVATHFGVGDSPGVGVGADGRTHWGEGPQAALVASEPLGNVPSAPVDGQTPLAKGGQPKKKAGRPKGSFGKKKKEAMRKARAAERAAAKAAKEGAAGLDAAIEEVKRTDALDPPETHEIAPDTVDVHAHMGPEAPRE